MNIKIAYVNGYKGETSNKPKILSKILGTKVDHLVYSYGIDKNYDLTDYDLVIASSTGALIIRESCEKYNVPLISINPVINPKETFKILGVKPPTTNYVGRITEMIIATEDDELIPFSETKKYALDNKIWLESFPTGGHRFDNLERVKSVIESFAALCLLSEY